VHIKVQFRFYLKLEDYTAESFTRGLLHIYIYMQQSSPVEVLPEVRRLHTAESFTRRLRPAESFTRGLLTSGLLHIYIYLNLRGEVDQKLHKLSQ
jgi:hypothetical protein